MCSGTSGELGLFQVQSRYSTIKLLTVSWAFTPRVHNCSLVIHLSNRFVNSLSTFLLTAELSTQTFKSFYCFICSKGSNKTKHFRNTHGILCFHIMLLIPHQQYAQQTWSSRRIMNTIVCLSFSCHQILHKCTQYLELRTNLQCRCWKRWKYKLFVWDKIHWDTLRFTLITEIRSEPRSDQNKLWSQNAFTYPVRQKWEQKAPTVTFIWLAPAFSWDKGPCWHLWMALAIFRKARLCTPQVIAELSSREHTHTEP